MTKQARKSLSVTLPEALAERLTNEAEGRMVATSLIVERAVTEWLAANSIKGDDPLVATNPAQLP